MNPGFAIIKGGSGSGKGTRLVQVLKFLQTKYKSTPAMVEHKNKPWELGTLIPELKLLFIGDVVQSNKSQLASWNSMDRVHSTFGSCTKVPPLLLPYFNMGYTIVAEGEPLMRSDRWRPARINSEYGIDRFFIQYYSYFGDREKYDRRITDRSGKASGEGGWVREQAYHVEWMDNHKEMLGLGKVLISESGSDAKVNETQHTFLYEGGDIITKNHVDEPLHVWGTKFLTWIGKPELNQAFTEFTRKKPMLRSIKGNVNPLGKTRRLF